MTSNVFISGINSGIGRLAALTLARRGHRVFGTMREPEGKHRAEAAELTTAAQELPGTIVVYAMELAMGGKVDKTIEAVLGDAGHLDVVVNNAGLTSMGLAETFTEHQLLYQLDVNLVGPHRVMRAVLPSMRGRGQGYFLHLSDTLGRAVLPTFGIQAAVKSGLEALMDTYRLELAPLGIESTLLEPGMFPTGFVERLMIGDEHERQQGYGPMETKLDEMGERVRDRITGEGAGNPQMVADTIAMLIELTPGSRPDRFVVDATDGGDWLRLNDALRRAQNDLLGRWGQLESDDDGDPEPSPTDAG